MDLCRRCTGWHLTYILSTYVHCIALCVFGRTFSSIISCVNIVCMMVSAVSLQRHCSITASLPHYHSVISSNLPQAPKHFIENSFAAHFCQHFDHSGSIAAYTYRKSICYHLFGHRNSFRDGLVSVASVRTLITYSPTFNFPRLTSKQSQHSYLLKLVALISRQVSEMQPRCLL